MRNNRNRLLRSPKGSLAMTGLMFGIALIFLVLGCGRKEPPNTEGADRVDGRKEAKKDEVEHKVLSFNLEGLTDKGDKKWEVIGRTARSISENEIALSSVIAKTYGDQEAVITADEGIYDKAKNNVRLEKNVKATIDSAGSLVNDQLGFPIDSPAPEDTAAKETAEKPKDKKRTVITCDGDAEFDYAKNLAYFKKNVKVRSEDGDIDADKITVNLYPATRKINDIVAEGHVKITRRERAATGDKANFNEKEK